MGQPPDSSREQLVAKVNVLYLFVVDKSHYLEGDAAFHAGHSSI